MKSIVYLVALLIAVMPFTSHAEDMMKDAMMEKEAKPTAVMFFSANCGSCKILDPRMKEALAGFEEGAIDVVVFDFTNKDAIATTTALAEEKGLTNVLQEYGARTGFVALVDKDGNIADKINVSNDVEAIKTKLNALI